MILKCPEKFRCLEFSSAADGNNGLFYIPGRSSRDELKIIASDGGGWDHVSVSKRYECPTWDEMCRVKAMFWDDQGDYAVQYHPAKSQYVNNHPYCLHLWRPNAGLEMSFPESWMVGVKSNEPMRYTAE